MLVPALATEMRKKDVRKRRSSVKKTTWESESSKDEEEQEEDQVEDESEHKGFLVSTRAFKMTMWLTFVRRIPDNTSNIS